MAGNGRAGAEEHELCKRKGKVVDTHIKCAKNVMETWYQYSILRSTLYIPLPQTLNDEKL